VNPAEAMIQDDGDSRRRQRLINAAPELLAACDYVAQFKGPMSAEQFEVLAKRCKLAADKARGK